MLRGYEDLDGGRDSIHQVFKHEASQGETAMVILMNADEIATSVSREIGDHILTLQLS